jgi:hypothetical protein
MARNFDAVDDVISITDSTTLRLPSTSITIAGWIYTSGTPDDYSSPLDKVFATTDPWHSYMVQKFSSSTRQYRFGLSSGSAGSLVVTATTTSLAADTWFFLVCRWTSGQTLSLRVYNMDGTINQTVTSALTSSITIGYAAQPLRLGQNEATGFWAGRLANWAVWSIRLIDVEAEAFMRGVSVRPNSIAGFWPIFGIQSPEPDWSGNNNHGTVTGAVRIDHPPGISAVWLAPNPKRVIARPVYISPMGQLLGSGGMIGRLDV